MTQGLAKYHARAPRYILNTQDDSLIRVAGPQQIPWEEGTEIRNVSLTGLAFTAPDDLCPALGEVIKIQFSVPGSQQMACYGIVTRLDPENLERILVGIHFYKLDMPHRIVLAQGLSKRFIHPTSSEQGHIDVGLKEWYMVLPNALTLAFLLSFWSWLMQILIQFEYQGIMQMALNLMGIR